MAYTGRFGQSDEYRREELIRKIEHSLESLTLQEFLPCKRAELEREALYYDMSTNQTSIPFGALRMRSER